MSPKVSIILPTYRVENYIRASINSCQNQSFKNIEIIVVDDCGGDGSIKIARELAKSDHRIRIIKNIKNLGTMKARIAGALCALCEYIMYLDPDDELSQDAVQRCYEIADSSGAEMVTVCFKSEGANASLINPPAFKNQLFLQDELAREYLKKHYLYDAHNTSGHLIKREVVLSAYSHCGLDGDFNIAEDLLSGFLLLNLAKSVYFSNIFTYYHRYRKDSMSRDVNIQKLPSDIASSKACYEFALSLLNKTFSVDCEFNFMKGLFYEEITKSDQVAKNHQSSNYEAKNLRVLDLKSPHARKLGKMFVHLMEDIYSVNSYYFVLERLKQVRIPPILLFCKFFIRSCYIFRWTYYRRALIWWRMFPRRATSYAKIAGIRVVKKSLLRALGI